MNLNNIAPTRGAVGELFTIVGSDFGAVRGRQIASINRGRVNPLTVVSWSNTRIRVRIPAGLAAGNYKVLVYYDNTYRTSTGSVDFWVTAAPVPYTIRNLWAVQVRSFRIRYGKTAAWETWMLANRDRYINALTKSLAAPDRLNISWRYETTPIAYNPPWVSEAEHMAAFRQLAILTYPGYDFWFRFGGDPATSYSSIVGGIATITSHISGNVMYLYYENIFAHEFGHIMNIAHHYGILEEIGMHLHMPPGETQCTMDRNSSQFCSACRTAMNMPLDVNNEAAITAAMGEISRRYPY